ncbi:MAG: GNAT family N-acetyltransferase [Sphingomonadales bacterium]|nr:GNAT family N-acetyltransferase [Sphingomonadales bacterium]
MSWPETPTLAGRHVTLRPLARADRAALLAAFADGFAHSFAATVPDGTTIDGWFDTIEREHAAQRSRAFAVLDAAGRVAGTTRFHRMNETHRRLEIGGTLYAARVRRTGLNTEAKRLLLAYAFEVLEVFCVQIRTDFLNQASRRAIERLGAKQDGILRGHMVIGEHRRDTVSYSILAHEWPGVRRRIEALMDR